MIAKIEKDVQNKYTIRKVTEVEEDALKRKFGIKEIPSYIIYDKKGEQIYFKTGFEGVKKIGKIIDKHLE